MLCTYKGLCSDWIFMSKMIFDVFVQSIWIQVHWSVFITCQKPRILPNHRTKPNHEKKMQNRTERDLNFEHMDFWTFSRNVLLQDHNLYPNSYCIQCECWSNKYSNQGNIINATFLPCVSQPLHTTFVFYSLPAYLYCSTLDFTFKNDEFKVSCIMHLLTK